MITLTTEQAQQIEEALDELRYANNTDIAKTKYYKALATIREARAEQEKQEPVAWQFFEDGKWWIGSEYNHHRQLTEEAGYPIRELYAAHGQQAEQEPFDMDDHPPHRLCECRKCMEYFTPLPDCDAFAGIGKPLAEQTNTQFMKGFRPVSEMIAEHKQDPKKAAAIEKAKMRKAEQEPVGWLDECGVFRSAEDWDLSGVEGAIPLHTGLQTSQKPVGVIKLWESETGFQNADYEFYGLPIGTHKLYAAPVRTKDLTDDEIHKAFYSKNTGLINWIRAVIAADREKNK